MSAYSNCGQILVAIGCRGTSSHIREVYNFCPFLTHFPSIPSPPLFLRTSTGQTNIDGWWLKRRVLARGSAFLVCQGWKIHLGGLRPQKPSLFRPSREITAKTLTINNFQTVRFCHLLIPHYLQEIDATCSKSAKIFSPQCPLSEIFELLYRCPVLATAIYWKLGPDTDWNVIYDS